MSDSRVDLDTVVVVIIPVHQGEGSWAGCFTLQLMFHCGKARNNKTPPQPDKRHLTRTPSPLKAGSYRVLSTALLPKGSKTILAGITDLVCTAAWHMESLNRATSEKPLKKSEPTKNGNRRNTKIFICERNVSWLTKTREGC